MKTLRTSLNTLHSIENRCIEIALRDKGDRHPKALRICAHILEDTNARRARLLNYC